MNKQYYTPEGMHPEDAIEKAKEFINELQTVQETYFNKLVKDLHLTKSGEEWLFDYVYNTSNEEGYDGFRHYLEDFKQKYENLVNLQDMLYNSAETFLSTDFGEFSPMLHMSSLEPELETAFPSAFNDKEPIAFGLDTITMQVSATINDFA